MKPGTLIFCNCYPGSFLSKAIRFFTDSNLTHVMYAVEDNMGEESVFSAEMNMEIMPYADYSFEQQLIFEWQNQTPEFLQFLIDETRRQYNQWVGNGYAIARFTWFMWVWLVKKLGRKDVKKMNNWFPRHNECGTLTARLMLAVATQYYPELLAALNEWYVENLSQNDVYQIVKQFPDIFKLTANKGFTTLP